MYGEIYIDVVFVTNLLMDYIVLRITGRLLRLRTNRWRYLAGGAAGAFFSCLILYLPFEKNLLMGIFLHGRQRFLIAFRIAFWHSGREVCWQKQWSCCI